MNYRKIIGVLIISFVTLQLAAQNVGIGTTTPQKKLHIVGTGDVELGIQSSTPGGHLWTMQAGVSDFQIIDRTLNAARLRITNSGRVGIGTSSPSAGLHVNETFRLKNGVVVNGISDDPAFAADSDSLLVTQHSVRKYLSDGSWVSGINPSDSVLSFLDSTGANIDHPSNIFVSGTYAYVVSENNSLLSIFDVSVPGNIVPKGGTSSNLLRPTSVFVSGNYAYVASDINERLCVFDVSDKNNIIPRGYITTNIDGPVSVYVQGSYAYVLSQRNDRLCIFDISDPDNIVPMGFQTANLDAPYDIYVQGNYAYVTSLFNNRLCIFDISNPLSITPLGFTSTNLNGIGSVYVQGNYAYVTAAGNNSLCVFDVSNPAIIVPTGVTNTHLSGFGDLIISGNYAFIISTSSHQLAVFDITDPNNIRESGSTSQNLSSPVSVGVQGNYAYVVGWGNDKLSSYRNFWEPRNFIMNQQGNWVFTEIAWEKQGANIFSTNGNVGIGISVPLEKLHVNGNANITGNTFVSGNVGIGTLSPTEKLDVNGNTNISGNTVVSGNTIVSGNIGIGTSSPSKRIHISGATDQEFGMQNTSGGHFWTFQAGLNDFQFIDRTLSVARLSIDHSGLVDLAAIKQDAVSAPALQNSWINFGGAFQTAGYYKDKENRIHLQGAVKNGLFAGNVLLLTFPAGYRPPASEIFVVDNGGGNFARIEVQADGDVILSGATGNSFLSLSGISFRAQ